MIFLSSGTGVVISSADKCYQASHAIRCYAASYAEFAGHGHSATPENSCRKMLNASGECRRTLPGKSERRSELHNFLVAEKRSKRPD